MANEVLTAGSTSLWKLHPHKDGSPWTITSATLTFTRPDGTQATKTATVSAGVASYAGAADLFAQDGVTQYGTWHFTWKGADAGGAVIYYRREAFTLEKAP